MRRIDPETYILERGDIVRLRPADGTDEEWVTGSVVMASENGQSVGIMLHDVMLRGADHLIGGFIPVTVDYQESKCTVSATGMEVDIDVSDPARAMNESERD